MMDHHANGSAGLSEEAVKAWKSMATAQGLVCMVCYEAPSLERRDEFYDTGLCDACARSADRWTSAQPSRGG